MPIYEYLCPSCGATHDKLKKHARADEELCQRCGERADRQISSSVVKRGTGEWSSPGRLGPPMRQMRRGHGMAQGMTQAQVNSLPVVGRDGKLYDPSGKKVIRE
jgi:putative FmdB family regulatory protein